MAVWLSRTLELLPHGAVLLLSLPHAVWVSNARYAEPTVLLLLERVQIQGAKGT